MGITNRGFIWDILILVFLKVFVIWPTLKNDTWKKDIDNWKSSLKEELMWLKKSVTKDV